MMQQTKVIFYEHCKSHFNFLAHPIAQWRIP